MFVSALVGLYPATVLVGWTEDVDKAYGDLVAAGAPTVQPPHDSGNDNRNALLRDPDGNLVGIVAQRPDLSEPQVTRAT
jgi:lactoylglutathione lyase